MPPHCDAMDGPVVKAAIKALEAKDVSLILPYVHKEGETEVIRAFEKVLPLREDDAAERGVADLYFFETVVRVHQPAKAPPIRDSSRPGWMSARSSRWPREPSRADRPTNWQTS